MNTPTTSLDTLVETARGHQRNTAERHRAFSMLVQRFQDMVDLLIRRGARIEAHDDRHDATALHWAVYAGHFWWQTHDQRPQVIHQLADAGIDPNIVHPRWGAPLHLAAQFGQIGLVKALLACGARQDIRNAEGKTAKQVATENRYKEIAGML